jgi:PhoPQ-activated pathogenicity-related protein
MESVEDVLRQLRSLLNEDFDLYVEAAHQIALRAREPSFTVEDIQSEILTLLRDAMPIPEDKRVNDSLAGLEAAPFVAIHPVTDRSKAR